MAVYSLHKLVDYFIHYYRKIKKFLKNIIFSLTYGKSALSLLIWIGRYIREHIALPGSGRCSSVRDLDLLQGSSY
jgi:hypothetical protein